MVVIPPDSRVLVAIGVVLCSITNGQSLEVERRQGTHTYTKSLTLASVVSCLYEEVTILSFCKTTSFSCRPSCFLCQSEMCLAKGGIRVEYVTSLLRKDMRAG